MLRRVEMSCNMPSQAVFPKIVGYELCELELELQHFAAVADQDRRLRAV